MSIKLSDQMSSLIADKIKNPAEWMLAVREIVELAGANPAYCIDVSAGSLNMICWSTLDKMKSRISNFENVIAAALASFERVHQ